MIEIKNLSKEFQTADGTVEALKDVSLTIHDLSLIHIYEGASKQNATGRRLSAGRDAWERKEGLGRRFEAVSLSQENCLQALQV